MRRVAGWLVGALLGALVWIYDYDFFLNAGGARTPISRFILESSGLQQAEVLVFVFWPLAVLVALGAVLGFTSSQVLRPRIGRRR